MILQVAQQPNNDQLSTHTNVEAIGKIFRLAREEKKLAIEDVARATHIRRLYLLSIESGDFTQLPGGIYTVGFIKTYALFLDLDAADILRQLGMDAITVAETNALVVPIPTESQERPQLKIVVLTCSVALIVLGLSYFWHENSPISSIQDKDEVFTPTTQNTPLESLVNEEKEGDTNSIEAETQTHQVPQEEQPSRSDKIVEDSSQYEAKSTKSIREELYKIAIFADKDSWVQILDNQGKNVFVRLMHSGEIFEIPADHPPYKLNTGNAAGIRIRLNNETTKALGGEGKVVRGISLAPEDIKQMGLTPLTANAPH
jgi:cytoskeleton protein RodZ